MQVPCNIVDLDEVLAKSSTPLMASMRYLRLLLLNCKYMRAELKELIEMRKNRRRCEQDLERPYHAIVLSIYEVRHILRMQNQKPWQKYGHHDTIFTL